jgi:hypothetical protein
MTQDGYNEAFAAGYARALAETRGEVPMIDLFPGKVITTVSYGQNPGGFPTVVVFASDGTVAVLVANGHAVDPEFTIDVIKPTE